MLTVIQTFFASRLAGYDQALIIAYLVVFLALAVYGFHRSSLVYLYYRYRSNRPEPLGRMVNLPKVDGAAAAVQRDVRGPAPARGSVPHPLPAGALRDPGAGRQHRRKRKRSARRRWPELAAQGHNIVYVHRTDRTGFKAGALEHGLKIAQGEFVLVFDADFIPEPDVLERTIHFFSDPKVAMVQVRWDHLNRDYSALTEVQALMLDGHFVIEHTARHRSGRFFNFNGTGGIWRRSAIIDAGGWQHDTLTEDMDLSYRAQLRGWQFIYLPDVVSPAELPVEMNSFKSQQFRWAKGSIQVAQEAPADDHALERAVAGEGRGILPPDQQLRLPAGAAAVDAAAAEPPGPYAPRLARGAAHRPAAVLWHDAVGVRVLHHQPARDRPARLAAHAQAAAAHDVARYRAVHQPDPRRAGSAVCQRVG